MITEFNKGTGAVKGRIDLRDHKWSKIAMAPQPFDWAVGYNPEDKAKTKDQGQSFSCGGQSGAYLNQRLLGVADQSAKSIYSLVYVRDGGSAMRDVLKTICKRGVNLEKDVPSTPTTEAFLRNIGWITPALNDDAGIRKGLSYAFITPKIDSVASAVRDTGGAIILIRGENNGSWLSAFPKPPKTSSYEWAHFVFVGGAKLIDGKKYIRVHNSWGNDTGEKGWQWIGEDYFNSGHIIEAGVLYRNTLPDLTPPQKQQARVILQDLINYWYKVIDSMKAIK